MLWLSLDLMSTHNICFFMENWRKLPHNYQQILIIHNSSGVRKKNNFSTYIFIFATLRIWNQNLCLKVRAPDEFHKYTITPSIDAITKKIS